MANGLIALERLLAKSGSGTKTNRASQTRRRHAEGMNVPSPSQLRQTIDVVQGTRPGQPSNSLRALEDRLLKRSTRSASQCRNNGKLQTRRLDHGQAPVARIPSPATPNPGTLPPSSPVPPPPVAAATAGMATQQGLPEQAYSPEFSAPNTGRFHVEPFSEPTDPQSLFQPDPAVASAPAQPSNGEAIRSVAPPVSQVTQPATPPLMTTDRQSLLEDDDNWLNQAGQGPQKISNASREALDSKTAVAAEDFEKDLQAILGHPPAAQPSRDQSSLVSATAGQAPQESRSADSTEQQPPHPTHDVFDQMGLGMKYANSFDLGAVNLQERFNQFERELAAAPAKPVRQSRETASPFVNPYADAMDLDEFDLVAELAEIGADYPQPSRPPQSQSGQAAPGQTTSEQTKDQCAPAGQPVADTSPQPPSAAAPSTTREPSAPSAPTRPGAPQVASQGP